MLWLDRFSALTITRTRAALALTLIAAAACADRALTGPQHAATQRAARDNNPASPFAGFSFSPLFVAAGGAVTGTITLVAPAPPGGARITISITRPDLAFVDSVVIVPEGHTTQTFLVQTYGISRPDTVGVELTANWGTCCWMANGFYITPGVQLPPPPTPTIIATPSNLTFGSLAIGSSSAPQIVTVRNIGSVNRLLYVTSVSGPFTRTSNCPATLVPNGSCTISVVYVPTSAGAQSGLLTVPSSDPVGPAVVTLNGTGVATPAINLTPGAIGFGSVTLGNATSGRVLKITSTGTAPLVVSSLTVGGANPGDFSIVADGCTGVSLNPGTSCTAYVSFEPLRIGARTATVTIAHNASGGPAAAALSGAGVKPAGGYIP